MENEIWVDIPEFVGAYQVSNLGRVRSLSRTIVNSAVVSKTISGKILTPLRHPAGHMMVNLGRAKRVYVHRLVLRAFVGPCPAGQMACHNDGNHQNNRLDNLRYDTARGNQMDRVAHGTSNRGVANGSHKLTPSDVASIRRLLRSGLPQREIGATCGVSQSAISDIALGKTWAHLP